MTSFKYTQSAILDLWGRGAFSGLPDTPCPEQHLLELAQLPVRAAQIKTEAQRPLLVSLGAHTGLGDRKHTRKIRLSWVLWGYGQEQARRVSIFPSPFLPRNQPDLLPFILPKARFTSVVWKER